MGLAKYTSFNQITSDTDTAAALQQAYGSVDAIDLWIGGLAENHLKGAMIGQTFGLIIANQFEALRDGDRYWYEIQGFDKKTLQEIKNTSLSDIILRNTDTEILQKDVFVYTQRVSGTVDGIMPDDINVSMLMIGSETQNDILKGGNKSDTMVAGSGNDRLDGSLGRDVMTGGAGADKFVFSAAISPSNVDTITDFRPGQDKIELSHNVFKALSVGDLPTGAFQIGLNASTVQVHILYDAKNGGLYYDADGNGAAAAQQFAVLPAGLQLTKADFLIS
jgi:peroxidase